VRARLFWKLGFTYLALLLGVLIAVGWFAEGTLRHDAQLAAQEHLASLSRLVQDRPPAFDNPAALQDWAAWMAKSGVRATVITADGLVLADSDHDPQTMENHSDRPEFLQALARGEGDAIRHSATLDRDLLYHAVRLDSAGHPVVVRLALPLAQVSRAVAEIRRQLLLASLVILVVCGIVSLIFSRVFAGRVGRLKDFSLRIAQGDFRALASERPDDELSDLGQSLNETASRMDAMIRTLTQERNRSSAILRSMVEGVAVIDARERVVFCNRAFAEILNIDPADCENRPLLEVIRHTELLNTIRTALVDGVSARGELEFGTVFPRSFAVTATPVETRLAGSGGASSVGAVAVLHDISELRRLERVRQDFVANVSHEFKTPLTAIQGFAETLLGGALEDENNNRRFLEIIRDQSIRLAQLTDDLLRLARIEAGKLELDFRPVQLAALLESLADTYTMRAARKQLSLTIDCSPDLPDVLGDASLLREVLQNLLDNAMQYTPPGGSIGVSAVQRDDQAVFTVSDTGVGIPLAAQERIFERFYRVDAARSREVGGTGLGLSISKHIVESHGGKIWVESDVSLGSRFHFSIPLVP
jgi:two-component system phosphate regulon sensor histidine kinase PhoR